MKKIVVFIVCFFSLSFSYAQYNAVPDSLAQDTVMLVDTTAVRVQEFLWFNTKYNAYADKDIRLSLKDYAQLFADYKRKVIEAKRQQLDTVQAFKDEFDAYMQHIANSHLFKDEYEQKLIALEYERLKSDYEVQHVFVRSNAYANPKDTLKAYQKAQNIIADVRAGKDFSELAQSVSDDTFTKKEGGYNGYITALLMPIEYENAVYSSKVGEILGPIKTEHGYFVIKVLDKRPTKGQRRASIIVFYPSDKKNEKDWDSVRTQAQETYVQLQNGVSFDSLSMVLNKNAQLRKTKGDIGWFDNSVRYHPTMKEPILNLDSIGAYAEPIKMDYGYVIARITGIDSLTPFSEYSSIIADVIKKDETRKDWKRQYAFQLFKGNHSIDISYKNFEEFISLVDNSILMNRWKVPQFKENKPLLKIDDTQYYYSHFAEFLKKNQKSRNFSKKDALVRFRFEQYSEKMLAYQEFMNMLQSDSLKMLSQEYFEGMIMYELMQKEVYKKALTDSAGLYSFYEQNKTKYMNPPSVNLAFFTVDEPSHTKRLVRFLNKRPQQYADDSVLVEKVSNRWTQVSYNTEHFFKGTNSQIDSLQWKEGNMFIKDSVTIGYINEVIAPFPKEFIAVKTQLIADYQVWLEQQLLARLQEIYPVTIKDDIIERITLYTSSNE
ncbi:MAG: peptidylprolyl isomerase [Bacteroidales bacterium]|jgi:peptidyl-prolyl cis-trans isomerase SurA|nr:peptidylprolyl isomerase [Bacteroidales bacterium]